LWFGALARWLQRVAVRALGSANQPPLSGRFAPSRRLPIGQGKVAESRQPSFAT
jgi:hypothetical protein